MEITEKWLGEIGGWQVMKAARGLVNAGLASALSAEEGLIRGVAGSGKTKFTSGLRIRSRTDVENLCTCMHARRSGQICEHAIAVVLAHLQEKSAPVRPVTAQTGETPTTTKVETREPPAVAVPGQFAIYLPETILQGQMREPVGVFVKFQAGGDEESSRFAGWLAGQGVRQAQSLPISLRGEALGTFLQVLADHPRVFAGKPNGKERRMHVATELTRLPLVVEPDSAGGVRLRLQGAAQRPVTGAWWICQETGALFRLPADHAEIASLAAELAQASLVRSLRWFVEKGERLSECFQMELRGGLERFHVSPAPCEFEIHIDGSLQNVEVRLHARHAQHRWPVVPSGRLEGRAASLFPIQDEEGGFVFLVRNWDAEGRMVRRLEALGFKPDTTQGWRLQGSDAVLRFYASDMARLREVATIIEGERWRNVTRGVQRIVPQTRFTPQEGRAGGGDWLGMEFAYESADGFRLGRAEVLRLVRSGQRSVQAKGKRYILDTAAVEEMEESLRDVPLELTPEGARVHGAHAAYFGGEDSAQTVVTADEIRSRIGDLAAMLRPYQMEGVCWMTSRVQQGRGGVLADEMGLGKTVQSIALALGLKQTAKVDAGPVLVVCPKSLLSNWQSEFERFAPTLKVLVVQGTGRDKILPKLAQYDVVLTSYQLLVRDAAHYQALRFRLILLDEASFIRNPDTDAAKTLRSLKADGRVALTGTPLENGVRDLWSIFQFALPGYLGDDKSFKERFESPIQSGLDMPAGQAAALRLQKLTRPYFLRRMKRQVLKDLPEKIEQVLWCTPSSAQAEFYRKILEEGREEIKAARRRSGQGGAKMTMFTVLLRLRQVCCDLRLTGVQKEALAGLELDDFSGKWASLHDQIESALESGGKVLVFSQFVQFLRLMRERLKADKLDHAYLDGSSQDRAAQVERFQKDPHCRVFLISLKAGGYGLNLTAADTVILADPWWNPAVEAQAIDRAHRIGQPKVVNAYRLAIRGTVEERILKLQAQKRGLVEATLNDQAPLMEGLSEGELEELLS